MSRNLRTRKLFSAHYTVIEGGNHIIIYPIVDGHRNMQSVLARRLRDTLVALEPGDHYWIPAGLRHRVASTAPDGPTIWLTVHRSNR